MEDGKIIVVSTTLPVHADDGTREGIFAPSYSSISASILYGLPESKRKRTCFMGLKCPKGMDPPEAFPSTKFRFYAVDAAPLERGSSYSSHISKACHAALLVPALSANNLANAYEEYAQFNEKFANAVVEAYSPGDVILVLSKDLWLLPGLLRNRILHARICTVISIPFPPYEIFSCIPYCKNMMLSILSSDRVEFQAAEYAENFRSTAFSLVNAQYKEVSPDVLDKMYGGPNRRIVRAEHAESARRDESTRDLQEASSEYRNAGFLSLLSSTYASKMKLEDLNLEEIVENRKVEPVLPRKESEEMERRLERYLGDCLGDGSILKKPELPDSSYIVYVGDLRSILCLNRLGAPKRFLGGVKKSPQYREVLGKIQKKYTGRRIVLCIETTRKSDDPIIKLQAICYYLSRNPETDVHFIRCLVYGESSCIPNTKASGLCEQIAACFPGKFQSLIFPGLYEYVALLSIAELCLACSPNDSLSLVLNEFIEINERGAPVIVPYSSGVSCAGAFFSLNCAHAMSALIEQCLSLGEKEKAERRALNAEGLLQTPEEWLEQAGRMMRVPERPQQEREKEKEGAEEKGAPTRIVSRCLPLNPGQMLEEYKNAASRLFLLDYDGTLTEIVQNPRDAAPTPEILEGLALLAAKEKNRVCIITGRGRDEAEEWFGKLDLVLYAEHGAYRKEGGAWTQAPCSLEWLPDAIKVVKEFVDMTPGSHIEVKNTCVVFHCGENGRWCANALHKVIGSRARVVSGRGIIEVRPMGVDKGSCVLREVGGHELILCFGDDLTDEDMFMIMREVQNSFSVCVGSRETCASWRLGGPKDLRALLRTLSASKE